MKNKKGGEGEIDLAHAKDGMLAVIPEVEADGVEEDGVDDRDGHKGHSVAIIIHRGPIISRRVQVDHRRLLDRFLGEKSFAGLV